MRSVDHTAVLLPGAGSTKLFVGSSGERRRTGSTDDNGRGSEEGHCDEVGGNPDGE